MLTLFSNGRSKDNLAVYTEDFPDIRFCQIHLAYKYKPRILNSIWNEMEYLKRIKINVLHRAKIDISKCILLNSQLGNFSYAWNLAILQVGPQSGMIFDLITTQPPTHQYTQPPTNRYVKNLIWRSQIPCGCQTGCLIVSGRYLEGVWKVSEERMHGIKMVSRQYKNCV